jgi:hypothetical protein
MLAPHARSGPSPQPTNARCARGEELRGERTSLRGQPLLATAEVHRRHEPIVSIAAAALTTSSSVAPFLGYAPGPHAAKATRVTMRLPRGGRVVMGPPGFEPGTKGL